LPITAETVDQDERSLEVAISSW